MLRNFQIYNISSDWTGSVTW